MRVFAIAIAICVASAALGNAVAAPNKPAPKAPKKPPDPPASPEKLRADKLFDDGRRYLAAKEYALACTAFEQSQASDPAIGTLLNIALCYETWGKTTAAYRWYLEAEQMAKQHADDRVKGAKAKVDELAPKVPHLRVVIPADAEAATTFMLDGNEIERAKLVEEQLVEPGKHTIVARLAGKPPRETIVDIKESETKTVTIDVPRPEVKLIVKGGQRKPGRFYGGIAMLAGGGVALGVAGYVSLVARQDYADALVACPMNICETQDAFDATRSARNKANAMTFVGAGGLALVGVGVWFVLTSKTPKVTETQLVLAPQLGPDGFGVALGGRL